MSQPSKFASLQILRALAAWTVVFHHYMQWYFNFESRSVVGLFFSRYGAMGVDVFFVLSGFVVFLMAEKTSQSPLAFIVNRFFRIVPLYWFYSMIAVLFIIIFPLGFHQTSFNFKSLVSSFAFLPYPNPSRIGPFPVLIAGWTLNFEMFFYVVLALCMAASRRYFFAILSIVLLLLPVFYPADLYPARLYSWDTSASPKLWEFLAGAALAVSWHQAAAHSFVVRRSILSLAIGLVFLGVSVALMPSPYAKLAVATSIVLVALLSERYISKDSRTVDFFVKLGNESYSTYLAHGLVLGAIIHITGRNLSSVSQSFALACYIVGTYLVSVMSYRYLECNRYLRELHTRVGHLLSHAKVDKTERGHPVTLK